MVSSKGLYVAENPFKGGCVKNDQRLLFSASQPLQHAINLRSDLERNPWLKGIHKTVYLCYSIAPTNSPSTSAYRGVPGPRFAQNTHDNYLKDKIRVYLPTAGLTLQWTRISHLAETCRRHTPLWRCGRENDSRARPSSILVHGSPPGSLLWPYRRVSPLIWAQDDFACFETYELMKSGNHTYK